jgi:molybdopterin-guanine dinucleotide biosynthesis protein B
VVLTATGATDRRGRTEGTLVADNWIQIVGAKDTGKTSLIEALTRELVARGRSVAYIKHTHVEPALESDDTDTARVRAAGAGTTALAAREMTITVRSGEEELEGLSFREAAPADIVLAEGFKGAPGRKIAIAGGDLDISSLDGVVAVVGEAPGAFSGSVFSWERIPELCNLVEKLASHPDDSQWSTRMLVNGREIPMNAFVQDVTAATVRGITEVMRDVPDPETIELKARRIPRGG